MMADWKRDYNRMVEQMIYDQNPPAFETLIMKLEEVNSKINNVEWDCEFTFL
jgi:hypothetical protein